MRLISVIAVMFLALAGGTQASAHAFDPGYLELRSAGSERWRAFWRAPPVSEDPIYEGVSKYLALRNYVAMGATDIARIWKHPDGVFYPQSATTLSAILDGICCGFRVVRYQIRCQGLPPLH